MATTQTRTHWEDLAPGTVRELGSVTPTREDILAFAKQFDPQPFHLSDEGGRNSVFGALCASGWHTCAMAMKLTVENMLSNSTSLGSPGLDNLRWLKPVYPGDTLTLTHTILEQRGMRSRPEVGLVRSRWDMRNQDGEPVLLMEGWGMFGRRTPATEAEIAQMNAERASQRQQGG